MEFSSIQVLKTQQSQVLSQILKNRADLDPKYAQKLSKLIIRKSQKYGISAKIFAAILMQESSYEQRIKHMQCGYSFPNEDSTTCVVTDFGISQINYVNIDRFGLDRDRLVDDLDYALDIGAKILAEYKSFQKSEPVSWWTRYHCGTGTLNRVRTSCEGYRKLVVRYL